MIPPPCRFLSLLLPFLGALLTVRGAGPGTVILDNTDGAGLEVVGSWVSAQDVKGFLSDNAELRDENVRFRQRPLRRGVPA